jgi:hypothetical protein
MNYMLLKAETAVDERGCLWLMWADNPTRPWEFHSLILTDEHGNMVPQ